MQRELLTAIDAAALLGVSRAHFYRMHNAGRIPLPIRLGGAVRWRVDELRAWIDAGMPNRQRWQVMYAPKREGGRR
jgi:excisionase family DNA binding protein